MVEGPEIRKMSDRMIYIVGQCLLSIEISNNSRYFKKHIQNIHYINRNEKIRKMFVIGKKIFIRFKTYIIILSMGLTGTLSPYKDKHNSLTFILDKSIFYMNDIRKFGSIIIDNLNKLQSYISKLGYDPIYHRNMTYKSIYNKFIRPYKSKQSLGRKLLDQRIFAGLGNYLRAEILYDCRIDHNCKYDNIPYKFWSNIIGSYKKIYIESYEKYIILRAYKRKDKPEIITIRIGNRTLWYSPKRIKFFC